MDIVCVLSFTFLSVSSCKSSTDNNLNSTLWRVAYIQWHSQCFYFSWLSCLSWQPIRMPHVTSAVEPSIRTDPETHLLQSTKMRNAIRGRLIAPLHVWVKLDVSIHWSLLLSYPRPSTSPDALCNPGLVGYTGS